MDFSSMHFLLNTFIYVVFLGASHLAWEGNIPTVQTVANWPWVKWIPPSPSGSWKGPKYLAQDHKSEGEKWVRWETRSRKEKSIWREKDTGVWAELWGWFLVWGGLDWSCTEALIPSQGPRVHLTPPSPSTSSIVPIQVDALSLIPGLEQTLQSHFWG